MIVRFNNTYLQAVYEGKDISGKPKFGTTVIKQFKKVVKILSYIESTKDLYKFKGLHYEKLVGDLEGYHSCRVDLKYRLILSIDKEKDAITVTDVEIAIIEDLTNHYD